MTGFLLEFIIQCTNKLFIDNEILIRLLTFWNRSYLASD